MAPHASTELNDRLTILRGLTTKRLLLGLALASVFVVSYWTLKIERIIPEELDEEVIGQRETTWPLATPAEVGLNEESLEAIGKMVGGAGVIVRGGKLVHRWGFAHRPRYAASVKKSLISVLNWQAVEQGLLSSIDDYVVNVEPRLGELNEGRDAMMTWRHLACMTSGYGLVEAPGKAFAYNDYAVALWYDALMQGVYREDGTQVLIRQLAEPLGFEDKVTFKAMGEDGPEPKLRISARDLARFGLMMLQKGIFNGQRVFSEANWQEMISSEVPVTMPFSSSRRAPMLPDARTMGGEFNISPIGPGRYTFHLWRNVKGPSGNLMLPDAPEDTLLASGKWGEATLWMIPSLDMVVAWNDSDINDHHTARHNPEAEMNLVAKLLVQAAKTHP